jgi:transposase
MRVTTTRSGPRSGRSTRPGMSAETLRKLLRQAEVDAGQVPSEPAGEIRELKRKNAELERTGRS